MLENINAAFDMIPDMNTSMEYVKNLTWISFHTLFPVVNEVHGVSLAKG